MSSAIAPPRSLPLAGKRHERNRRIRKYAFLYLLFLVPLTLLAVFSYAPIYGLLIAFKDFSYRHGILGSPWNDFAHFELLFSSPYFFRVLRNTIVISFLRLFFGFPAPILLALAINEVANLPFKKAAQTISYLPHFLSWVVLSGMIVEILSPQRGVVGFIYGALGMPAPNLLIDTHWFRPMLVVTGIWKTVGWSTIVYIAAISSINPELYECASIDGAGPLRKAAHITVPSLVPVMIILFILQFGHLLSAGFDQIFNLYSPLVYEVADIIDTYVYRQGIVELRYDYSTAVGLFKNVIGVALLFIANYVTRRFSEFALW